MNIKEIHNNITQNSMFLICKCPEPTVESVELGFVSCLGTFILNVCVFFFYMTF